MKSKREDWAVLDRIVNPDETALVAALEDANGYDVLVKCFPVEERELVAKSLKRLIEDEFITPEGIPLAEGIDYCQRLQNKLSQYDEGIPIKPEWKADPKEFLRRYPNWFDFIGSVDKTDYAALANNFAILSRYSIYKSDQKGYAVSPADKEWEGKYRGWVKAAFTPSTRGSGEKWVAVEPYAFQTLSIREADLIWFKNPTGTFRAAIQVPAYAFLMNRFPGGVWYAKIRGIKLTLKGKKPLTMTPLALYVPGVRRQAWIWKGFVGLVVTVQGLDAPEIL